MLASDFGDAPAPYPTLLADNGASHEAVGPQLGPTRSFDVDGLPSPAADADASDDGVTFGEVRVGQLDATVTVNVQNAPAGALLDAWIDFNGDGSWGGAGERIFASVAVAEGDNLLTFDVPADTPPGATFARFRLRTFGGLGVRGAAMDGEVEDYQVVIANSSHSGVFKPAQLIASDVESSANVFTVDFDDDGDLDALFASSTSNRIEWHEQISPGQYDVHSLAPSYGLHRQLAVLDLDADGDLDIVPSGSSQINWYENIGGRIFVEHEIDYLAQVYFRDMSIADFDGDGDMDIALATQASGGFGDGKIVWYANEENNHFSERNATSHDNSTIRLFAADMNHDSHIDLIAGVDAFISFRDTIEWYRSSESGLAFIRPQTIDTETNRIEDLHAADYDKDGDTDILVAQGIHGAGWYRNNGDQGFSHHGLSSNSSAHHVAAADLDGDGDVDFLSNSYRAGFGWYENDGGYYYRRTITDDPTPDRDAFAADWDSDGDLDIMRVNGNNELVWHENVYEANIADAGDVLMETATGESLEFQFNLNFPAREPLTLSFAVSGSALVNSDYTLSGAASFDGTNGTVHIPAGETSASVFLHPLDDTLPESRETVTFELIDGDGYMPKKPSVKKHYLLSDEVVGDFGDAPAPYLTTAAQNGAVHFMEGPEAPRLGSTVDIEVDGMHSGDANGEIGDDGVTFGVLQVGQLDASVAVKIQGAAGKLDAWIDFNGDGSWGGPGERIASSLPVELGENTVTFPVPSGAISGTTYARFRVSTAGGLGIVGVAGDGEVEDYQLTIVPPAASRFFAERTPVTTDALGSRVVSSADIDGDGDLDLVSASTDDNRIAWYENDGAQNFVTHTISTVAYGLFSMIVADVDGDGDPDVVSGSIGDGAALIWHKNNGLGGFSDHLVTDAIGSIYNLFAADVDADGDLDLATGGATYWIENIPGEAFRTHPVSLNTRVGNSISVTDVDSDGDLDLLVDSDLTEGIVWYENDGEQNFGFRKLALNIQQADRVESMDLDGDGDLDFLAASSKLHEIFWVENLGGGDYSRHLIAATGYSNNIPTPTIEVLAGDLDGDGDIDVLSASYFDDQISWHENDGAQSFQTHVISSLADGARSVAAADVDGDGDLDVLSASSFDNKIAWYENAYVANVHATGESTIENLGESLTYRFEIDRPAVAPLTLWFATSGSALAGVDYSINGAASFVGNAGTVMIPPGGTFAEIEVAPIDDSAPEFVETVTVSLVDAPGYAVGVARDQSQWILSDEPGGDFGDAPAPYRTLMTGDGAAHESGPLDSPQFGPTRDFEQDGQPTPAADADSSDDGVTFGQIRVGQLGATVTVNVQGGPGKLDAWIDFNGDGSWGGAGEQIFASEPVAVGDNQLSFDVPVGAFTGVTYARFRVSTAGGLTTGGIAPDGEVEDYAVTIEPPVRTTGDFSERTKLLDIPLHNTGDQVESLDLDADGDVDFLYFGEFAYAKWYENRGAEGFLEHPLEFRVGAIEAGDLDLDGDIDLVYGGYSPSSGNRTVAWLENDGAEGFTEHVLATDFIDPRAIAIADYNDDGRLDIAVGGEGSALTWFEALAEGGYEQQSISGAGTTTSLIPYDLDRDGDIDLVGARPGSSDEIFWYENDRAERFLKHGIAYEGGSELAIADMDGDGDGDIVVIGDETYPAGVLWYENTGGANFPVHEVGALDGEPAELAVLDFDGDGDIDVAALAKYGGSFDPAEFVYFENQGHEIFVALELLSPSEARDARTIFAEDFDSNGTLDLVVTTYDGVGYYSQPLLVTVEAMVASVLEIDSEPLIFRLAASKLVDEAMSVPFTLSGAAIPGIDYTIEGADSVDGASGVATIPAGTSFVDVVIRPVEDGLPELAETVRISIGEDAEQQAAAVVLGDPSYGDYGDAPTPYPAIPQRKGAAHVATGPTLGPLRTTESAGANSPGADGDAGDDGVTFAPMYVGKGDAELTVNVQNTTEAARLDGWIDFNGDGNWGAADERIFTSVEVSPGDNTLRFTVPGGAVPGQTFARFRLSTAGGLGPRGDAVDGEVEDYAVVVSPASDEPVNFSPTAIPTDLPGAHQTIPVDFDGDGDLDILTLHTSSDSLVEWHENDGAGHFTNHTIGSFGFPHATDLEAGDLDGDGDIDLVANKRFGNNRIEWLENDGSSNFVLHTLVSGSRDIRDFSLVDLDNDGDLDVVSTTYANFGLPAGELPGVLTWYENEAGGVFSERIIATYPEISSYHQAIDLDRDGDLDLVLSGSDMGDVYWYENDGEQNYAQRIVTAGNPDAASWPYPRQGGPVHAADLDGDGDLDVISGPIYYGGELRWFENGGDEEYLERSLPASALLATEITTGDLDGDGDLDVILSDLLSNTVPSMWLENRMVGDFNDDGAVNSADFAVWKTNYGATSGTGLQADTNGDGRVDSVDYAIWRESLDAPPRRRFVLIASPTDVAAGSLTPIDLDGDGDLDLVGTYGAHPAWFANSAAVELTGGAETAWEDETTTLTYTVTRDSRFGEELDVAIDFSGAAKLGVDFTTAGLTALTENGGVLTLAPNADAASFTVTIVDDSLLEFDETFSVRLVPTHEYAVGANLPLETTVVSDEFGGDFGDAPAPFPTSPNMDGPRHSRILATDPRLGATRGEATAATTTNSDTTDDGVDFGDLHIGRLGTTVTVNVQGADGLLDAWIDFNGDGSWGGPGERISTSTPVTVGDNVLSFDIPSWAVAGATYARFRLSTAGVAGPGGFADDGETEDYAVEILPPAIATGEFAPGRAISSSVDGPNGVYAIDLDRDGDLDYVSASGIDGTLAWHENDGQQVFTEHFISDFGEGMWDLTVEDFDADNDWDIVVALKGTSNRDRIYFYRNNGDQVFNSSHYVASNVYAPSSLFPVDMDGDGDMDLISAARGDDEVTWYENYSGQGYFRREEVTSTADGANDVVAVDLDRDGDMDLVAALLYDDAFLWFENDGSQSFTEHSIATGADGAASIFVTDLDGDGDLDVVGTLAGSDTLAWYENDGAQNFAPHVIDDTADGVSQAVAADVDGDGDLDIAAAVTTAGEIRVYINDGSQQFTSQTISSTATGVSDLLAADADGDGDLDLIATAYGSDQILWYENYLPGDYSRDHQVTSGDFTLFRSAYGSSGVSLDPADGNFDGKVDAVDYAIWRENLGASLLQAGGIAGNGAENSGLQSDAGASTSMSSLPGFTSPKVDSLSPSRSTFRSLSVENRQISEGPTQSEHLLLLALDYALATSVDDAVDILEVEPVTKSIDDDFVIDDGLIATDKAFDGTGSEFE